MTKDLAKELQQLETEDKSVPKKKKAVKEIEDTNTESVNNAQLIADLQAENERLKELLSAPQEVTQPANTDPNYDWVSVYVPYNAQGLSRNNGFDPESGESYVYTIVKAAHKPEGETHHRFEEYRIRLDSRVVVPRFVAEILGDRADVQEYNEPVGLEG